DGTFLFSGLHYGDYELFAEIPGKSIIPRTIVLSESQPAISGVEMVITQSEIIFLNIIESKVFKTIPMVYPNPAGDRVNIGITLVSPAKVSIHLTDISGRVLKSDERVINGKEIFCLDLDNIPQGLYFLNISAGQEMISTRIARQ
ncbi:MAG: T9SS type A sorting domain-containing protein, partial [Bacteroidales bacterium]|nr:T9SS type A sorting domain-containing protein [Bacteroidales bacterium]